MRWLLVIGLAALLPGCFFEGEQCKNSSNPLATCSYGFSGVSASVGYANATWDRTAVGSALEAWQFELRESAQNVVVGTLGNETLRVTHHADGRTEATIEFRDARGLGYTRAETEAMADAAITAQTPRAERVLDGLEQALSWTRTGELRWSSGIMVI